VEGVEAEAELLAAMITLFQRVGLGPRDVGIKVRRKLGSRVTTTAQIADLGFISIHLCLPTWSLSLTRSLSCIRPLCALKALSGCKSRARPFALVAGRCPAGKCCRQCWTGERCRPSCSDLSAWSWTRSTRSAPKRCALRSHMASIPASVLSGPLWTAGEADNFHLTARPELACAMR